MSDQKKELAILLKARADIDGAISDFKGGMQDAEKSGKEAADGLKKSWESSLTSIRNQSAVAFAGVTAAIGTTVHFAAKQEDAVNKARAAIKLAGGDAEAAVPKMLGLASSLQDISRFGDEDLLPVLAQMIQLTGDVQGSMEALPTVVDMAATGLWNLDASGRNVAKAMLGVAGELGELIPELRQATLELDKNATASDRGAAYMDVLKDKFKGAAAEEDSFTKSSKQLGDAWGDTLENFGKPFLDMLKEMTPELKEGAKATGEWAKEHEGTVKILGTGAVSVTGFVAVVSTLGLLIPKVVEGIKNWGPVLRVLFSGPGALITGATAAIGALALAWDGLSDAMTSQLSHERDLNKLAKDLGVTYDELYAKQVEFFGKFDSYETTTQKNRDAWDAYVAELIKARTHTVVLPPEIKKVGDEAKDTADKLQVNASALRDLMNAGLDFKSAMAMQNMPVFTPPAIEAEAGMSNEELVELEIRLNDQKNAAKAASDQHYQELENVYFNWRRSELESYKNQFLSDTQVLQAGYSTALQSMWNSDMTGKQRREAVYRSMAGALTQQFIRISIAWAAEQVAMQSADAAATAAQIVSSNVGASVEIANANRVAAAWEAAYARKAAAAAGASIAGGILGPVGLAIPFFFAEGGVVPGSGYGDKVAAMLTPGERVIPKRDYQQNGPAIEYAIRGGSFGGGGGNNFTIQITRDTTMEDTLRIMALLEQNIVPVLERKIDAGEFRRNYMISRSDS